MFIQPRSLILGLAPSFSPNAGLIAPSRLIEFYLEETVPDLLVNEFKSTVPHGNPGILGVNPGLQHLVSNSRRTKEDLVHKGSTTLLFLRALLVHWVL